MTLSESIVAIAVAIQAIYAIATFHRDRRREQQSDSTARPLRPIIVVALLMLTTWAAVGFDYYDRHYASEETSLDFQRDVVNFGTRSSPLSFYIALNTADLLRYKNTHRLILIIRMRDDAVDRSTDAAIEKSTLYAISGAQVVLVAPFTGKLHMAVNQEANLEFHVFLLPVEFSAVQVTTLGDVEKLGAIPVAGVEQGLGVLESLPSPTLPEH